VSKEEVSAKVAKHIGEHDRLIGLFDMKIEEARAGFAKVSMTVGPNHLNAAGLCHGAALFALADVAFALAVNCYGKMALAIEASMNYFRPVRPKEKVTASCRKLFQGRRTGTYLCSIENPEGKEVAVFKATAFRVDEEPVRLQG